MVQRGMPEDYAAFMSIADVRISEGMEEKIASEGEDFEILSRDTKIRRHGRACNRLEFLWKHYKIIDPSCA
jgi:hypothetical protein